MTLIKDFGLLFLAITIPAALVLGIGALIDVLPVLGWIVMVAVVAVAVCFLTILIRTVRGK